MLIKACYFAMSKSDYCYNPRQKQIYCCLPTSRITKYGIIGRLMEPDKPLYLAPQSVIALNRLLLLRGTIFSEQ